MLNNKRRKPCILDVFNRNGDLDATSDSAAGCDAAVQRSFIFLIPVSRFSDECVVLNL